MNNKKRITLASFLAYFIMSGMLAPIGIVSAPMATALQLPITTVTAGFSWLTMGILIGAVVALFVFDWAGVRRLVIALYAAITIALITLRIAPDARFLWPSLGLIGVACGIGLAAAALTISRAYNDAERASMLVITDGAFSVAGIVCSQLAVFALAKQWHWATSYACLAVISAVVVILAISARYPQSEKAARSVTSTPWPLSVWLCVGALFLYTLGQYAMLWWLPNYLTLAQDIDADRAGKVVSQFWSGMFAAQLFVAWWVLKTGAHRLALLAGLTTLGGSIPLWLVTDINTLLILAALWGFANLGLLKVVLSFATEQVAKPSPRLVSLLLLGATLGTAVSPWLTSTIVEKTSFYTILQFSSGCYLMMLILIILASLKRAKQ